VVWPFIQERLSKWATPESLARHLCVEPGQIVAWLLRAEMMGLVERAPGSGEYIASGGGVLKQQLRLEL
jgi:predicted Rossmann fold nucleotide-binding protein DprA/Smf involved in DNA uptake